MQPACITQPVCATSKVMPRCTWICQRSRVTDLKMASKLPRVYSCHWSKELMMPFCINLFEWNYDGIDLQIHGWLMAISWGFLIPIGVMSARYLKEHDPLVRLYPQSHSYVNWHATNTMYSWFTRIVSQAEQSFPRNSDRILQKLKKLQGKLLFFNGSRKCCLA